MSVKVLPDGRARVRVYVGYENGKRKLIDRIAPNEREAKRLEAKLREQVAKQEYVEPSRLTIAAFLDEWLERSARPNVKPRTFERYEQLVRVHLKPRIGTLRLDKLEPRHVDGLLAELKGQVADRTRLHVYRVLHRALEIAVRWRYVGRNVCDAVEPPKADEPEMYVLSADEVNRLLLAARGELDLRSPDRRPTYRSAHLRPEEERGGTRLYALYLTALHTGMRQGELLALRWQDVDAEAGIAWVRQTLERGGRNPVFGTPKNRKTRPVPLSPQVLEALRALKAEQEVERAFYGQDYRDFDLVFSQANGGPMNAQELTRKVHRRLREKAGLPPQVRFHDLRHTFVSRSLAAGANPRAVSEVVGHFDPGFTLKRYAHALASDRSDVVERLQAYLGGHAQEEPEA